MALKTMLFGYRFPFKKLANYAVANGCTWSRTITIEWGDSLIQKAGLEGNAETHRYPDRNFRPYIIIALASKDPVSFLPSEAPHPAAYKKLRKLLTDEKLVKLGDLGSWHDVEWC